MKWRPDGSRVTGTPPLAASRPASRAPAHTHPRAWAGAYARASNA